MRLVVVCAAACAAAAIVAAQDRPKVDFTRDVEPIFRQRCIGCHGPTRRMNGLRLDRRRDAMRGGTISVIGPGNSQGSRLYLRLIGNTYGAQMPPTGGHLRAEQIDTIKTWIDQGAEWPDTGAATATVDPKTAALLSAALRGDATAVRAALDAGADPNARTAEGVTPLMWATDDLETTRVLLDRGADVNARSDVGRTPVMIAAGRARSAPVVKLLLDRGAKVDEVDPSVFGETALSDAAYVANADVFRMLVDRGADLKQMWPLQAAFAIRSGCTTCLDAILPAGNPTLTDLAIGYLVPPFADATAVPALLARGVDASYKDGAGRTLLMLAAHSDAAPVDLAQTLLAGGADVNLRAPAGDTALSAAKRRGQTRLVDLLVQAGAKDAPAPAPIHKPKPAASARAAVARSLPLLQRADATFLERTGCVSCHHNTLTAMTVAAARPRGFAIDEAVARQQAGRIGAYLDTWRERALQGVGLAGEADAVSYILVGLAAEGYPPDAATGAMARYLKNRQVVDGHWWITAHRPPIESTDLQVTAASLRALQVYAPRDRRAEYDAAIRRAKDWLRGATASTTEARAFQILGLTWAGGTRDEIQPLVRALAAEQRADGGWAQVPTLASDAYATGQALVALRESNAIAATDPVFTRATQFLVKTQLEDGSWFVRTRALPIQPPFESGFPHGRDQWISAAATNWAAMALALGEPAAARER